MESGNDESVLPVELQRLGYGLLWRLGVVYESSEVLLVVALASKVSESKRSTPGHSLPVSSSFDFIDVDGLLFRAGQSRDRERENVSLSVDSRGVSIPRNQLLEALERCALSRGFALGFSDCSRMINDKRRCDNNCKCTMDISSYNRKEES